MIKVNVEVCSIDDCDSDWPGENINDFLTWINKKIESIPVQFRENASIEISGENRHQTNYAKIDIYYFRPETQEEERKRIDLNNRNIELRKIYEVQLLEELKRKYES